MENDQKECGNGVQVQTVICDRQTVNELSSDYSLPDYCPEIRRLLRVSAVVMPAEKFIGSGSAELSGTVQYRVLYSGSDGSLYSVTENGEYQFSVPVEIPAEFELADGVLCDAESVPDAVTGRVAAPRRLSLRCRLRSRVRLYGTKRFAEEISGADEADLQRLTGTASAARRFFGVGEALPLGDEILFDAQSENLRVIASEGTVVISDAEAGSGCVNCRGELCLKLLCCRDGSDDLPFSETRRIPFSQSVPVEGAEVNCAGNARGVCVDLKTTVEAGRILCEASVLLEASACRNEEFSYTRDAYSLSSEGDARYADIVLPRALSCVSGNFSLNTALPLAEAGIRPGFSVVDVSLFPVSVSLECGHGKCVISGRCHAQLVLAGEGDMSAHELELPFRYEAEGDPAPVSDHDVEVTPVFCRARVDGERVSVDAELYVRASLFGEERFRALTAASFPTPAVPRSASVCRICYPSSNDTLWSVSKRYHCPVSALSSSNSLPSSASADSPDSLAGARFLIV